MTLVTCVNELLTSLQILWATLASYVPLSSDFTAATKTNMLTPYIAEDCRVITGVIPGFINYL